MPARAITVLWLLPLLVVALVRTGHAAEFFCPAGDVTCLIAGIDAANSTAEEDTILLEPGTYTLTAINNNTDGANGLPSIQTPIVIEPQSEGATLIERGFDAPSFRIFHVAEGGQLEVGVIAVYRGGGSEGIGEGGGILNHGQLTFRGNLLSNNGNLAGGLVNYGTATLIDAIVEQNFSERIVGGIANFGTLSVSGSRIAQNRSPFGAGAIVSCGRSFGTSFPFCNTDTRPTAHISNSTIEDNLGNPVQNAGGIRNVGPSEMTILNSTIVGNFGSVGGILNERLEDDPALEPTLTIISSTIARNLGQLGGIGGIAGGGIVVNSMILENEGRFGAGGAREIQNTIIAGNFSSSFSRPDCLFAASLGNNIIDDNTGCDIQLQPTDLVADPRLGEFVDEGPGRGYYPLLSDSPAIDAGNTDACPTTDQLSNPRVGVCDIGSVEFQDGRLLVSIDVRPRKDANRINPASTSNINVAVFSRNGFDANSIDVNSVRFGATGTEAAPIHVGRRDVDGDGQTDMVLRFQIGDTGIACGHTSATLTGEVAGGGRVIGSSPIRTVQCQVSSR